MDRGAIPQSLVPALPGEGDDAVYLSGGTWEIKWGIRTPTWKLIKVIDPGVHEVCEDELYDLLEDPLEKHNLTRERPAVKNRLELKLRR